MCVFRSRYEIFFGPCLGGDRSLAPPPRGSAAVDWKDSRMTYDGDVKPYSLACVCLVVVLVWLLMLVRGMQYCSLRMSDSGERFPAELSVPGGRSGRQHQREHHSESGLG